jgi:hypothetical protein
MNPIIAMQVTLDSGEGITVISEDIRLRLHLRESQLVSLEGLWLTTGNGRLTVGDLYKYVGVRTFDTDVPIGNAYYGKGEGSIVYDDERFNAGSHGTFVFHWQVKRLFINEIKAKVEAGNYEVWDLDILEGN